MKIAILIFLGLIAACVGYGPFVVSGRLSDQEKRKERESRK